jgi:hypothetical protein
MRASVFGASGFLRLKIERPLMFQSMMSRAGRHRLMPGNSSSCRLLSCDVSATGQEIERLVGPRHQDEALPRRRVAVVRGVELAPFRLVAKPRMVSIH